MFWAGESKLQTKNSEVSSQDGKGHSNFGNVCANVCVLSSTQESYALNVIIYHHLQMIKLVFFFKEGIC